MQPKVIEIRNVRRRLFQDQEENDNNGNIDLGVTVQNNEAAQQKWNFDFVNEVPLEGDWEWERVSPETSD